jgi:hypothetical protein
MNSCVHEGWKFMSGLTQLLTPDSQTELYELCQTLQNLEK